MAIPSEIRLEILQNLLVSSERIKPRYPNSSINNTSPNLTNITRVCRQLGEEALELFFRENTFYFDHMHVEAFGFRGPMPLVPIFFNYPGAGNTKSRMQKISWNLIAQKDWEQHTRFAISDPLNHAALPGIIEALKRLKTAKRVELLIAVPTYFDICKLHLKIYNEMYGVYGSSVEKPPPDCRNVMRSVEKTEPVEDMIKMIEKLKKEATEVEFELVPFELKAEFRTTKGRSWDDNVRCDWSNMQYIRWLLERFDASSKKREPLNRVGNVLPAVGEL